MHVHISFLEFLVTMAYVIIGNFLILSLAAKYHDTTFGQALGVLV